MEQTELTDSRETALEGARIAPSAGVDDVISTLHRYGIAILPGYFPKETLASLNGEFDRILARGKALSFNVHERDEGVTVAIVRNRLPAKEFPAIAEVFALPFMTAIARAHYGGEPVALNHQIYANLNKGTPEAVGGLPFVPHLDKIRTLKFFVYLTDTTSENGAMGVVPGSHAANRAHRLRCLEANADFHAVTNLVSDVGTVPVEGPAGTLFIFDTDVTHRAGHVQPGSERRILRGHTRTVAELVPLGLSKEAAGVEA